jgi:ubiquinone/menaquinone biosynthesis C-methylase UbiE
MAASEFQKMYDAETSYFWFVAKQKLVSRIVETLPLPPEARLLDLGCGTGLTLTALERFGLPVGLDCFFEALQYCAKRRAHCLVMSTGESLPFRQASFALATSLDSIEHTSDPVRVLRELHRTLAPSGWLLLTAPARPSLYGAHDCALGHKVRYTRRALSQALTDAGFQIEMAGHFFGLVFPLAAAVKLYQKRFGSRTTTLPYRLPFPLNELLTAICSLEAWLFPLLRLPFGTTLVMLCRKAAGTAN